MTDNRERQLLEMQLREIDLRRSQLEMMIGNLPPITAQCCDHGREQLEIELRDLWAFRTEVSRQLGSL